MTKKIVIPKNQIHTINRLMDESGIETDTELFNNALAILEWIVKEKSLGKIVASVDEATNSYKELDMPFFGNIKSV